MTIRLSSLLLVLAVACGCGPRSKAAATASGSSQQQSSLGPLHMQPQGAHSGSALAAAISPDGSFAASGGSDHTVKVWEVATGLLLRTLGHEDDVTAVAFSPDGRQIVSGSSDGRVKLWSTDDGALLSTLEGHTNRVSAVSFLGASRVLTASFDGSLRIWDATSGRALEEFPAGEQGSVQLAVPTRDGSRAVAVIEQKLHVLDLRSGAVLRTLDPGKVVVDTIAIAPDSGTVVASVRGGQDGDPYLRAWNLDSGAFVEAFGATDPGSDKRRGSTVMLESQGHCQVTGLAFSEGSDTLIAVWDNGMIVRLARGDELVEPRPPSSRIVSRELAIAADLGLAFGGAGGLRLLSTKDGAEIRSFGRPVETLKQIELSASGERAVSSGFDEAPAVWDLSNARLLRRVAEARHPAVLSPDGRQLVAASSARARGGFALWDLQTGEARSFPSPEPRVLSYSEDGSRVFAAADTTERAADWDLETIDVEQAHSAGGWVFDTRSGKQIASFEARVASGVLLRGGGFLSANRVHWVDNNNGVFVGEIATGAVKRALARSAHAVTMDGKLALVPTFEDDPPVQLYSLEGGQRIGELRGAAPAVYSIDTTPDGGRAITGSLDGSLVLWDLKARAPIRRYTGHTAEVSDVRFVQGGKRFMTASADGTSRLFDVETGRSVAFVVSGDEWLVFTDDGYFDASRRGSELVAAVRGRHAYRIEQLAVRNNRPDLVLAELGLGDEGLRAHFRARHELRLKKLGLRPGDLDAAFEKAPTASIGQAKQDGKFVDLSFELADPRGELHRYNVYVNDVPLFGSNGRKTSGERQLLRERIELTSGANKIEVSAINRAGLESQRALRSVRYEPGVKGELYFIGFGVSKYKDARLDLAYAHKDALDLGATLQRAQGGHFRAVHVKTYVDEQVTTANIRAAKDLLRRAKVDDTVVLFIAGHGTYSRDAAADYYYATHDVDVKNLQRTAAPFELIESLLDDIAPRRKLFLMDTCESGDREAEDLDGSPASASAAASTRRGLRSRSTRALVLTSSGGRPAKPRSYLLAKDRYIYNDLARRTGAIVFSSSRGSESSFESADWQNGAFTAEIKAALTTSAADTNRDDVVSTRELSDYVGAAVAVRTGDQQHPTVDRDNLEISFGLPRLSE